MGSERGKRELRGMRRESGENEGSGRDGKVEERERKL
jgi:hypothetical protein